MVKKPEPDMPKGANTATVELQKFVERIERLEAEKKAYSDDIREVYKEVKTVGFDPKILRKVIALRKQDSAAHKEEIALIEQYLSMLRIF